MLPVLPPTFDQIRARANLLHSVTSYSYVDNLYFLMGWKSRHAALSDAQKQYFYVMYPSFLTLEGILRRVRMIASFLMFIASILLSLPMAGVGLGVFAFAAPYLMPLLIASAVLAGVAFLFSTITFIVQEQFLGDPNVKILLENVEVLTKDFDSNKEKMNEAMKRLDVVLRYSRLHNGDKAIRRVLKDLKAFLEYEERSFMYEAHVGLLVCAIVEQVEADSKTLSEDMQQLLSAFHSNSLSGLAMDFYSANVLIPEIIDDVHVLLDVVQENMQSQDTKKSEAIAKKLYDMGERQKQLSEKLLNRTGGSYTALHHLTDYYSVIHNARQDLMTLDKPKSNQARRLSNINKKPLAAGHLEAYWKRSRSLPVSSRKLGKESRVKSERWSRRLNRQ